MFRGLAVTVLSTALLGGAVPDALAEKQKPAKPPTKREVLFVGNNWEGTADLIDIGTYRRVEVRITSGRKHITRFIKPKRSGKRLTATVSLRGLPVGTYRVTIHTVTKTGKRSTIKRVYKTCVPHGK